MRYIASEFNSFKIIASNTKKNGIWSEGNYIHLIVECYVECYMILKHIGNSHTFFATYIDPVKDSVKEQIFAVY